MPTLARWTAIMAIMVLVGFGYALRFYQQHAYVSSFPPLHSDHHHHDEHADDGHAEHDDVHHNGTDHSAIITSPLVKPLHPVAVESSPLVRLGWRLFNDPKLSSNGAVSCANCHHLDSHGSDPLPLSVGVGGLGERNSLTVFNVSNNHRFFWDGRALTLQDQMDGPVHHPKEMDSSWAEIVEYLSSSPEMKQAFAQADLADIDEASVKLALTRFMEALITPPSAFDRYLLGDEQALTVAAKQGWQHFQELGCVVCHQGENIGGSMLQRFGYYNEDAIGSDLGRFNETGLESDRFVFRVPSLRNVAKTAPYFHDGTVTELEEAIRIMARVQLGMELEPLVVVELSAFLHSLNSQRPAILEVLENGG
ncbi:cytochrome-c peroxidase [Aliagarivorans taiwanensis]|uniref:cytochrome-c peroxidase n=1 Tax=Aliagarivorans taiwanensis TaxID=561966 RepID=UPI00047CC5FD|nr:cytochrome c peroxidase [Aliagarivorans taiwanensis]